MGWLLPEQQKESKRKYKVQCYYECNFCKLPIPPGALMEIDPKGGYHPWPKSKPQSVRPFTSREPKVTYHIGGDCEDMRKGRNVRKLFKKQMLQASERILNKIESSSKRWSKERCLRYLTKKGYPEKVAVKAMKFIRKEKLIRKKNGGYVIVTCKVQKTKSKKGKATGSHKASKAGTP